MLTYTNFTLKNLYDRSPILLQNIVCSFYGGLKYIERYGKYFHKYYRELEENQWYSPEEIKELQNELLRRLIRYAYENVSYYNKLFRKMKLTPNDVRTRDDLYKLPIIEKEEVRRNLNEFRSLHFMGRNAVDIHTRGTTGSSLTVFIDRKCVQKEYAFVWLHRSWAGVSRKNRRVTLADHPVVPVDQKVPPFWRRNYIENQIIFSPSHITKENLRFYVDKLLEFQPVLIHGQPYSLYLLSLYLERNGISGLRPKAVFTHSETLLDFQRNLIETQLGCKVFSHYGNSEAVSHIAECEYGRHHVKEEYGIIEFLDREGNPASSGQEAEMVCTGLNNLAMPLIRYRIGDVAIPIDGFCSCGRSGRLVRKVVGRLDDVIITPDGRHIYTVDFIFDEIPNIAESQVIQETKDTIQILVVRRPNYSKNDTEKLLAKFQQRVGYKMRFKVKFVEKIPWKKSKFRFVISKVPLEI